MLMDDFQRRASRWWTQRLAVKGGWREAGLGGSKGADRRRKRNEGIGVVGIVWGDKPNSVVQQYQYGMYVAHL